MYAVVESGGKQYRVAPGDYLRLERLEAKPGDEISLKALMFSDGKNLVIDPSALGKVSVTARVVEQDRGKKVIVFKYKRRKKYQRKNGHRQYLTSVVIKDITA